jgi:hypothetical protein
MKLGAPPSEYGNQDLYFPLFVSLDSFCDFETPLSPRLDDLSGEAGGVEAAPGARGADNGTCTRRKDQCVWIKV